MTAALATVLALVCLPSCAALAAAPLTLTAQIDPPAALLGIPVRLILTVENTSAVAQALPQRMVVEVRPPTGERFIPDVIGFPVQMFPEEYRDAHLLKAGEKRVYDIPLASGVMDGAMADPRLWVAGTYGVKLYMHDDLQDDPVVHFGLDGLLGAGRISSPLLVSSEASLRVVAPTGRDAEIWAALLRKTEGHGMMRTRDDVADQIARELWAAGGNSPYLPYLIEYMKYTPRETMTRIWKTIVEQDRDHPVAETIRFGRAQAKALDAEAAIARGGDLESILRATEEARTELAGLQQEARHDLVRVRAARALLAVKSRERLIEKYRDVSPKR